MFSTPFAFMAAPVAGVTYLLDDFPGAQRAYSVRRLSSTYTGNALRVRRSSDNTEQDIGFIGEDLDTAALTSFVGAGNGFVTTLYDQSGNGANAAQSTANAQIQIVSSGTIISPGGSGKASFQASEGRSNYPFTGFTTNQVTQLMVGKKALGTSSRLTAFSGSNPGNASTNLSHWSDSNIYFQWEDYYRQTSSAISNIDYEVIFASTTSASTAVIWRNGSNLAGSVTSLPAINNDYSLIFEYPSNQFSIGLYQDLVIWNSDQSANAAGIQANVNAYYSIY